MDLRSHKVLVLDSSADVVRCIHGLDELLKPASHEVVARVGRRRTPKDEAMDVDQPEASTSTSTETNGQKSRKKASHQYLCGPELERALTAGEDLELSWPFRGAQSWQDWRAIEALWKHALTSAGPYHRPSNDSPLILTHPANLTASQLQNLALLTFERLNFPAVQILARPVAALYAMNAVSGVVVDIGLESTTITPVVDTVPHVPGVIEVQLGAVDCERYLVAVLRSQPALIAQLEGPRAEDLTVPPEVAALAQDTTSKLGRLATTLWRENYLRPVLLGGVALPKEQEEDGVTDIAAALVAGREQALMADKAAKSHKSAARREEDAKKKAAEEARKKAVAEGEEEADVASLEFEGRNVDVGFARQRFAEVLFAPELAPGGLKEGAVGVQEAVRISIGSLPNAQDRLAVWEGVSVIGELARVKTLPQTLLSYLMPYILTDPESSSEAQPKNTRFLRIPKYFPEYINEGGYSAPFLGAEIVGKLGFGESTGKYYTTKVDYNHHGPACFTLAPDLAA